MISSAWLKAPFETSNIFKKPGAGGAGAGGGAGIAPVAVEPRRQIGHHRVALLDDPVDRPAGEARGARRTGEEIARDRHAVAGKLLDGAANIGEDRELAPAGPQGLEKAPLADGHGLGTAAKGRELVGGLGGAQAAQGRGQVERRIDGDEVAQDQRKLAALGGDPAADPEPLDERVPTAAR